MKEKKQKTKHPQLHKVTVMLGNEEHSMMCTSKSNIFLQSPVKVWKNRGKGGSIKEHSKRLTAFDDLLNV